MHLGRLSLLVTNISSHSYQKSMREWYQFLRVAGRHRYLWSLISAVTDICSHWYRQSWIPAVPGTCCHYTSLSQIMAVITDNGSHSYQPSLPKKIQAVNGLKKINTFISNSSSRSSIREGGRRLDAHHAFASSSKAWCTLVQWFSWRCWIIYIYIYIMLVFMYMNCLLARLISSQL